MNPYYVLRLLGGLVFLAGAVVMAFNLWKTLRGAKPEPVYPPDAVPEPAR